jgi:hypothetical protein
MRSNEIFSATAPRRRVSGAIPRRTDVAKPPKSTPHSDIDGVHQDEKPNTETAEETGETSANLELARGQSKGKPPHTPNDEPPPH